MVFLVSIFLNYGFPSPIIQKHKLNLKNILESIEFLIENYNPKT